MSERERRALAAELETITRPPRPWSPAMTRQQGTTALHQVALLGTAIAKELQYNRLNWFGRRRAGSRTWLAQRPPRPWRAISRSLARHGGCWLVVRAMAAPRTGRPAGSARCRRGARGVARRHAIRARSRMRSAQIERFCGILQRTPEAADWFSARCLSRTMARWRRCHGPTGRTAARGVARGLVDRERSLDLASEQPRARPPHTALGMVPARRRGVRADGRRGRCTSRHAALSGRSCRREPHRADARVSAPACCAPGRATARDRGRRLGSHPCAHGNEEGGPGSPSSGCSRR